jgi:glycosyltransferase involved in cell wall biosynthesis
MGQERPDPVEAVFLYQGQRGKLLAQVRAGRAPDTGLVGLNHLQELGIDASVHRSLLRTKHQQPGLRHRLEWNLRELTAAWQLGDADVACSFWVKLFPLVAGLRGRPAVVAFNMGLCTDYLRFSRYQRRLVAAALRSAESVVCLASAQRDRLLRQYGVAPERVHAVLFGVDDRFYCPQEPPDDGYVLAVGRDMARDYATFAQALEKLDARAIIIANERNLAGVKLPPNTELRLDVSYEQLRSLYAGAACVTIPTRAESYPYGADCSGQTVLLDAMAMGRPIIASERATLSDYVRQSETALIVPPEDPSSLRSALVRVLGDRQFAETMGSAGRRLVEERLTSRHLAARLAPIIRQAAAR